MRIIIPMAGKGTRLRPHTLTVPKPLVHVAGRPIVQRLVESLADSYGGAIEEIVFITGEFGDQAEQDLLALAERLGAKGYIAHQKDQLGTAHAILCAEDHLEGNVIVAFADTLFRSDFKLDTTQDGVIWVQQVQDPSAYGVVTLDGNGHINGFVEKPKTFVSDLAIVGIYFFRDGANLRKELQWLIDHDVRKGSEYQLTDALENMKEKGLLFGVGQIEEWLDCGNKDAVVTANQRVLEFSKKEQLISGSAYIENSTIIEPCYIGDGAVIKNSVIGPHVSVGSQTTVTQSVISNSIVQQNSRVENVVMENSMLGNYVDFCAKVSEYSIGDYVTVK